MFIKVAKEAVCVCVMVMRGGGARTCIASCMSLYKYVRYWPHSVDAYPLYPPLGMKFDSSLKWCMIINSNNYSRQQEIFSKAPYPLTSVSHWSGHEVVSEF